MSPMNNDITRNLDDLLFEGLPDLVSPTALAAQLQPPPDMTPHGLAIVVSRWLSSVGAVKHKRYTKDPKKARTLWSVRNHEHYAQMGPAARLTAFLDTSD